MGFSALAAASDFFLAADLVLEVPVPVPVAVFFLAAALPGMVKITLRKYAEPFFLNLYFFFSSSVALIRLAVDHILKMNDECKRSTRT